MRELSGIEKRKQKHLKLSLEKKVESDVTTRFEDVRLIHRALPEMDLKNVSYETKLFGKTLKAPLIISAITGGTNYAKKINSTLANVAEELGIGIGVGSQRIAIEDPRKEDTFTIVRENAPSTLILGNIGCPQLSLGWGPKEAQQCIEMINADALEIHMNPLQEAVQLNGETNYKGVLSKVESMVNAIDVPIVMKETGCGIAYEEAVKLERVGVSGLELSGTGGTSWAAVEHYIALEEDKKVQAYIGEALKNWGIPTAISLVEISMSTQLIIIASGGLRTGLDMAKAIVLGADSVGVARPFLEQAVKGENALKEYIKNILYEFRTVMFLVGAKNIDELKKVPAVILGKTAEWLRLRGFNLESYVHRN